MFKVVFIREEIGSEIGYWIVAKDHIEAIEKASKGHKLAFGEYPIDTTIKVEYFDESIAETNESARMALEWHKLQLKMAEVA